MVKEMLHLAEDRSLFYSNPINSKYERGNIGIALNFQREVINQIAPRVQPDLIHSHDWMTGLIPAAAKEYELPCPFTVQNTDSAKCLLSDVEDRGIDAAAFWRRLFYDRFSGDYEHTRDTNPHVLSNEQIPTPAIAPTWAIYSAFHVVSYERSRWPKKRPV